MGASAGKFELAQQVQRVEAEPISAADPFWDGLLGGSFTVGDLYAALTPQAVRTLLATRSINLRILLEMTTGHCRNYGLSFDGRHQRRSAAQGGPAECPELALVANCLHILGRLLPFLLEPHADAATEAEVAALFWSSGEPADGAAEPPSATLGESILQTVLGLLFKPGFGLQPLPTTTMGALICPSSLQAAGVLPVPTVADASRAHSTAALRCLLTCFCETIYFDSKTDAAPADSRHHPEANRWLLSARTATEPALAGALLASLLNVALGEEAVASAEGWALPYAHLLSGAGQEQDGYVALALHVLLLLLDSADAGRDANRFWAALRSIEDHPPAAADTAAAAAAAGGEDDGLDDFAVRARGPGNFSKLRKGFEAMLGQPASAATSLLPGAVLTVSCGDELLLLLWHMLEGNAGFRSHVAGHAHALTVIVCQQLMSGRHEPSRLGMLHVCTFLLLLLSGERAFSVGLNRPIETDGPAPPAELTLAPGLSTHADLLASSVHRLLCDSDGAAAAALADMGLTILCNISPYVKAFRNDSCLHLLTLFDRFSKPVQQAAKTQTVAMPLAPGATPLSRLMLIVETFDNVLQYQSEGNARLSYGLVRRKRAIANLMLPPSPDPATPTFVATPATLSLFCRLALKLREWIV